jgi:hypothetical protein
MESPRPGEGSALLIFRAAQVTVDDRKGVGAKLQIASATFPLETVLYLVKMCFLCKVLVTIATKVAKYWTTKY